MFSFIPKVLIVFEVRTLTVCRTLEFFQPSQTMSSWSLLCTQEHYHPGSGLSLLVSRNFFFFMLQHTNTSYSIVCV